MLLLCPLHHREKFLLALQHLQRVNAGDLAYAKHLTGNVKFLKIAAQQLTGALMLGCVGREQVPAQLLQRNMGNVRQTLGHGNVPRRAGG